MTRREFNSKLARGATLLFSSLFTGSGSLLETAVIEILKTRFPQTYAFLEKSGYDNRFINKLLLDPRLEFYPGIAGPIVTPAESLPYDEYRKVLGVEQKITDGKVFLKENLELLTRVERETGVDRNVLVAILGVESDFGRKKGKRNPVGVFITMIEQIPERKEFGEKQLLKLLEFCEKYAFDPHSFKGSYAGAMEWAHFIPQSLEWGFVDGDKDGKPDPKNLVDSLYSVANYLQNHDKSGNAWDLGGKIEPGSKNWGAINSYNPDKKYKLFDYTKAVKEIAEAIDLPYWVRKAFELREFRIY